MRRITDEELAADRERAKDESFQRRMARNSGVIGIAGALIGGLIATAGGYFVTSQQLDAQAEQSRIDFLREERRQAYFDVLAAADNARSAEDTWRSNFLVTQDGADIAVELIGTEEDIFKQHQVMFDSVADLYEQRGILQIVGSDEIVDMWDSLTLVHSMYRQDSLSVQFVVAKGGTFEDFPKDEMNNYADQIDEKQAALVAEMREDIGSSD